MLEILEDDNIVKIINYTTTFRHFFHEPLGYNLNGETSCRHFDMLDTQYIYG